MSTQTQRQSDLFLGEDWKVLYESFSNINFKNFSFTSVKSAIVEYIRINYAEDFNDWTQNAEFLFNLDSLCYLAETLSYRIDLNSRDNLIDLSERKESILRLAKFLSYNPKRNYPARGKVKIRSVKTSQIVTDSEGRNLQNKIITWNDPSNPDWFEQFILVLNASLVSANPFGKPLKSLKNGNITTQLYRMNTNSRNGVTIPFGASVSGENMNFELVNMDIDDFGNIFERHPDPDSAKHILYLNDGAGNASDGTGFFMYFKQGKLGYANFLFDKPIENRTTDLDFTNVNELDVWVSKINDSGTLVETWTKVPAAESIVYNGIDASVRNVFSVLTRDNDQVSIRFSDGRFGAVPKGIFRIWARESNGLEYSINPSEIRSKSVTIQYFKNTGVDKDSSYDLNIVFDLFDNVSNASASEPNDEIKLRAPRVYYTQDRMVNGEDYNSYPLNYGTQINKIKSVNRIYSGQSRYFDNTDPTKKYSSTVEFGDDGLLYKEYYLRANIEALPTIKNSRQIISSNILPLLFDVDLNNFFLDRYKTTPVVPTENNLINQGGLIWNKIAGNHTSSNGYLTTTVGGSAVELSPSATYPFNLFSSGAYVQFENPVPPDPDNVPYLEYAGYVKKNIWAKILDVNNNGILDEDAPTVGPVSVDAVIPNGWRIMKIMPAFVQNLTTFEIDAIAAQLENNSTFGIRYDVVTKTWKIIDELNVSAETAEFSLDDAGDTTNQNLDSSWLIRVQYTANSYIFKVRLLRYVFESESISRFFFVDELKGSNINNNTSNRDIISILKFNKDLVTNELYEQDFKFTVSGSIRYADGYIEPRRVQVIPHDSDSDGSLDIPDSFDYITNTATTVTEDNYVFLERGVDESGFETFFPNLNIFSGEDLAELNSYDWENNVNAYVAGYDMATGKFYTFDEDLPGLVEETTGLYKARVGRSRLNYKFAHYTSNNFRIDPAITNVIDNYVLTNAYHKKVIEWKASDRSLPFPAPENGEALQNSFRDLDQFKMISDQLLWNPAKFKLLFGPEALAENQATIKVVKISNSAMTDNQVKQGILNAIEEYFDLKNWTFGEQIYTTELLAYIHKVMATDVASVILVPKQANSVGARNPEDIYQIRLEFNELPLNTATVTDIEVVKALTKANINA